MANGITRLVTMSQSRELQNHIKQLEDISSILNAMKNLAFMTVHKLTRLQELQNQIVQHIEYNAQNFLNHYSVTTNGYQTAIYIVIGSERGFCGDFNERLLESLPKNAQIIAIGSRLIARCESALAELFGANAEEEIQPLLEQLLEQLAKHPNRKLIAVYHDYDNNQIQHRQILPAFTQLPNKSSESPLLNLTPAQFFAELLEQYVLAVFYDIFYISLLTENRIRLQHLEGAVQHLEDQTNKLQRKWQTYRQEEITEEIEVILLNTEQF